MDTGWLAVKEREFAALNDAFKKHQEPDVDVKINANKIMLSSSNPNAEMKGKLEKLDRFLLDLKPDVLSRTGQKVDMTLRPIHTPLVI